MEQWKNIENYEGLYEVSNLGRVKSLQNGQEKILKPHKKNTKGYLQVGLWKDGKVKKIQIHRLVASAFIPNPNNLPQVNHKNENPQNNCVQNLEWCDCQYNIDYSQSKKVLQFALDGTLVKEWQSTAECGRNGFNQSAVTCCCNGIRKSHKGYKWKYA